MGRFTLITGASTGIGKALAHISAENGRDLVLLARSPDKLETLGKTLHDEHGVSVEIVVQDLATGNAVETTRRKLEERGLEIGTLVNNAGFGNLAAFHETDLDMQLSMLRLNIEAVTELTHRLLPPMIARGRGQILNVASTAALQPGPFMAVYYATKAYVLSFSEAITEELRGTGVTVTALCPGPTRTEFQARANMGGSRLARFGLQDARPVAAIGYRAMERGQAVAIPGLLNRLLALTVRVSPRAAVRRIVRHLNLAH